ncbi:SMI1/KNR4 family protein [Streptomyces niveus]|uniref:SMI1/KNR4 family protein n=1 Tax=Streptomyces niveus TaxID=193462 RepID=UPI00371C5951
MDDLIRDWERIENWLREHRRDSDLAALHPPASDAALQSLRDALPYPPHPHLERWLEIHGGSPMYGAHLWPGGHVPYDVEALKGGPAYMAEMLEEFHDEFGEDPEEWVMSPWADLWWLPAAGTHTGESLLIDHRPGVTYGNIIEIDQEVGDVPAVRWKDLGEMIRLMAESLETGAPMPYSDHYQQVHRPNEDAPGHLNWVLERTPAYQAERERVTPDDQLVIAAWERLRLWLRVSAPESYASLRPGVSDHRLEQAEQRLGFPLPAALRALWTLNDGVTGSGTAGAFFDGRVLMPIETALRAREFLADEVPGWVCGGSPSPPTRWTSRGPVNSSTATPARPVPGPEMKNLARTTPPKGGMTLPDSLRRIVEDLMAGTDLSPPGGSWSHSSVFRIGGPDGTSASGRDSL